jgi:hypothetical protein
MSAHPGFFGAFVTLSVTNERQNRVVGTRVG